MQHSDTYGIASLKIHVFTAHTHTHTHAQHHMMGNPGLYSRCALSLLTRSCTSIFPWNFSSLYHHPHTFTRALSSVQTRLDAWTSPSCIYSGQDSCLACIMCPLRAPSGRWKPTRACDIQRGSRHYGKVCKHMVLNRDAHRFFLECATHMQNLIKMQWGPHEVA